MAAIGVGANLATEPAGLGSLQGQTQILGLPTNPHMPEAPGAPNASFDVHFFDIVRRICDESAPSDSDHTWSIVGSPATGGGLGWILGRRANTTPPPQGWKLHVSATLSSAGEVLERVLPILFRENAAFKVAPSLRALHGLNHGLGGNSQIGKFITIYPGSDEHAVMLATLIDEATRDLTGPAIPSDRALRPGGITHYRYGGFDSRYTQTPLGEIVPAISTPDGRLVPDRRGSFYRAPEWAADPFAEAGLVEMTQPTRWVADRYLLLSTLFASPRGPIYMALDFRNSRSCVIKRASPGAVSTLDGCDAQERLRNEAFVLGQMAPDPRFPAFYDLVEQDGDLFLAMEDVEGVTLASRVKELAVKGEFLPSTQVAVWGREMAASLHAIHRKGLVYRDVKSTNVIATPGGNLRLIDLELCCEYGPGAGASPPMPGIGTQGYMSPQQAEGTAPSPSDDVYSLGALLYFMATGAEPSVSPHLHDLLCRPVKLINPACDPRLVRVIGRCLQANAKSRYKSMDSLGRALARIAAEDGTEKVVEAERQPTRGNWSGYFDMARRLGDAICEEAQSATGGGAMWVSRHPSANNVEAHDINLGMSGTILALCELVSEFGDRRHRETLNAAAHYLRRAPRLAEQPLPGLYVGEAGAGLALLRAGQVLGDEALILAALRKGRIVQGTQHLSPDLFNGTAGRLRFHLRLWSATHEREHLRYAIEAGEYLLASADAPGVGELKWIIPPGYDGLSWDAYLGYAHGAAGIADALLDLYETDVDQRWLNAACAAGRWLARQAVDSLQGRGLLWPTVQGGNAASPFWCHGSAGIGRFFMRLAKTGAFDGASEIAHRAAISTALGARWAGPTQCHGLAGNIEFLLDMFQSTEDEQYLRYAEQLGHLLRAFASERDGQLVWPSDTPGVFTPDYMVGYAGIATCLLRLGSPGRPSIL